MKKTHTWVLRSTNLGGTTITEGGLLFIGAALDDQLHAFDIETGELLWTGDCLQAAEPHL